MIRLGLCCIFRNEPIKFRNTTATAIGRTKRVDALAKLSGIWHGQCRGAAGSTAFLRC